MTNSKLYKKTTEENETPFFYSFLFTIFLTIIAAIILILSYKKAIKLVPNRKRYIHIFNPISDFNRMKIPLQLFPDNKIRIRLSDEEAINYAFDDSDNENSILIYKKEKMQPL
ncbi:hypothetical protein PNEG_02521 [Pneumocystis murina B123]|uniref:Uncharacterized protein n=1 Tax=Pneumocystis murina (strain B123) TaxID=1069680 RepID=M7NPZ0_PNEMU|nr:hypothetical protein PNEG_02521 [Pneumocystis murina B123]EMR09181.1 hypothetical protein PNEG_02521 [Pneumocystis murina B123]